MGENLVMNMESKGFTVAVSARSPKTVERFSKGRAANRNIICAYTLEEFVASLEKPRKVMLMIRAGDPVDEMIDKLLPLLEAGDVIMMVVIQISKIVFDVQSMLKAKVCSLLVVEYQEARKEL